METVNLTAGLGRCAIQAAGTMRNGGIIVYPTDTLYGLGADAFSDETVNRVYAIKGREEGKPVHCVVSDFEMAAEFAEINAAARRIAERLLPGALTLVLRKKPGVQGGIARGMDTIGIRIPKSDFCLELARSYGKPFTTTSANASGMAPERTIAGIIEQLGPAADDIDLAIDAGELPASAPSTVINLVSGHPSILREGAVSSEEIFAALRS